MRLDSFSKILLATGQINYMAASMHAVNEQMKFIPDEKKIHAEGIAERDIMLAEVVSDLMPIMEKLADLLNNRDCVCAIDERVSKVPFEILIDGKDECEELYDEED